METQTRIKKAETYIEGALGYLEGNPQEWSIKQARTNLKNARTLLVNAEGKLDASEIEKTSLQRDNNILDVLDDHAKEMRSLWTAIIVLSGFFIIGAATIMVYFNSSVGGCGI